MAPNWPNHILIAFGGTLGNPGIDVWANTIRCTTDYSPDGLLTEDDQDQVAGGLITPIGAFVATTFTGTSRGLYSNGASLEWIKVNSIGHDGKYAHPNTTIVDVSPAVSGAGNNSDWRPSVVLTWRTALQRGRAHVGRIYPAGSICDPGSPGTPYMPSAVATAAAAAGVTLLQAIKALVDTNNQPYNLVPCVVSPDPSGTTGGYANPITDVEVDRVMDTQRRRTNRVPRLSVSSNV